MYYVSESMVESLVTQNEVTEAIEHTFVALADGDAICFPIVRETLNFADAIFGFKSGFDRTGPILGVKAGGLWPGNAAQGILNHQSTILIFDENTGAPSALVRATYLTGLRTAAASALSIKHLARNDSKTLGMIGAGGQGSYQLTAALNERDFDRVIIYDPNEENAEKLATTAMQMGLTSAVAQPEELARASDVIITVTPSRKPIVMADWIKPGTHLACMGADTVGKQEVEAALVAKANLFGDVAEQAVTLGESQHAYKAGLIEKEHITTLGAVINQSNPGRSDANEITIFDSTGMALQDLAAGRLAVKRALEDGRIIDLED
ncbi:MAG: ornithine cyclodeaminase family protein [Pseudomonadota bacterium]